MSSRLRKEQRCSLKISKLSTSFSHAIIKINYPYMTSSLNQHQVSTAIQFSVDDLKKSAELFPKLTNELKKGDCGKVGLLVGQPSTLEPLILQHVLQSKLGLTSATCFAIPTPLQS
uniref:Uncharacterized protein n=1 Tax=Ditylenchus dipsaci TaxID=166011 RepID=A0A915D8Z9_9BILA